MAEVPKAQAVIEAGHEQADGSRHCFGEIKRRKSKRELTARGDRVEYVNKQNASEKNVASGK